MITNRRKDRGSTVKLSFCKIRAKKLIKRVFLIFTSAVNTCFIHFLFIQVKGIRFIKSGTIRMKEETNVRIFQTAKRY